MVFRLGCVIPSITDGTSLYRAAGPLQALEMDRPELLRLETGGQINWCYLRGVHAVFMQRPSNTDHMRIMSYAKLHSKPVWIDFDDDLYSVPLSNPTHGQYSPKAVQNNLTALILQADVVSVSTEFLQRKFQAILEKMAEAPEQKEAPKRLLDPRKIVVIPNAYDEKLLSYSYRRWFREPLPEANLSAIWRGSHTHDADLHAFTVPLQQAFSNQGHKWTLNFIGSPFWGTIEHLESSGISGERIIVTKALDPIEYFQFLHATRPAFVFVPLVDDPFNRSKSNIAWIESTHSGAVCLAPDWEEWRRPGVINYKNMDDFRNRFAHLLRGGYNRDALVAESRAFISQNLTLSRVNIKRVEIIETLMDIDPWN